MKTKSLTESELAFQTEEKEKRAAELTIANKELAFQNKEKEKRAAELRVANKELAFQNEEKKKRAAELVIADKELAFQNEEKENRAAELIIANKELIFQNEEKEKRAAELAIADKELAFQNEEKEKRAAELVIADKELAFQNEEKGKRASELVIADIELAFQNEEKENRAAELIIANKELIFQNEEKEKRAEELVHSNKEHTLQFEGSLKEISDYKYALDESSIVAITDQKGIITYVNDNFCKISKYKREELIGQDHRIINSGFHSKEFIRGLWTTVANGKIWRGELKNKAKDSSIYWVDTTIVPFLNEQKKPYQYVAIRTDITNRKEAEELLVQLTTQLQVANKELIFQNEEKENRAAELIIANSELVFQNEEKEKRAAELTLANNELAFQNEEKENRASELIVANNELIKTTEALRQSNELFFKLFDYNPVAIVIADILDGKLLHVNDAFLKLFGFSDMEEVIGKSTVELNLVSLEQRTLIHRAQDDEVIKHFEVEAQTKNGVELCVSTSILRLYVDGTPCVVSVIIDITERKKAEKQLKVTINELAFQNDEKEKRAAELIIANKELAFQNEEKGKRATELLIANKELVFQNEEKEKRAAELITANNELGSFSYSVSHDLRAPLRAIHGYSRMLKEDYGIQLDPEANRLMNNIMVSAKKMGQLIDDLLTFSRLGRKELLKRNILMQTMVADLCLETKTENSNRNIQFKINDLEPAMGDSAAIKQVWINLISNAVKYSKQNEITIIEIGSEIKEDEIIYSIKDNGVGFDMRYAGKLFGVFQRLHTDEKFEGTGVGLAIVHRIISKHKGRVWAEGKVNEGAIFNFSLPKESYHETRN